MQKFQLLSFRLCNIISFQVSTKRSHSVNNKLSVKNSMEKAALFTKLLSLKGNTTEESHNTIIYSNADNTLEEVKQKNLNSISFILSMIGVQNNRNNKNPIIFEPNGLVDQVQMEIKENIFENFNNLKHITDFDKIPSNEDIAVEFGKNFGIDKINSADFQDTSPWTDYIANLSMGKEMEIFLGKDMKIAINSMLFWQISNILESSLPFWVPMGLKNAIILKLSPRERFWINLGISKNIYFIPQYYGIYDNFLVEKGKYTKCNENIALGILFGFGVKLNRKIILDFYFTYDQFFSLWEMVHFFSKLVFGYPLAGYRQYYDNDFQLRPTTIGLQLSYSFL